MKLTSSQLHALREFQICVQESGRFHGRGIHLTKYPEYAGKLNGCTVFNEANLIGSDNVGVTDSAAHGNNDHADRSDDSNGGDGAGDDDGDPDSDPDKKRRPRKKGRPRQKRIFEGLPKEGCVRLWQVLAVIPVGKSTWWQGIRDGRFPRSIKFGPNRLLKFGDER